MCSRKISNNNPITTRGIQMAIITVYLQIDEKKGEEFDLTDSVPFTTLVPMLQSYIRDFPDKYELYLKIPSNRSLADYGVSDGDVIVIKSERPVAQPSQMQRAVARGSVEEGPQAKPTGRTKRS